MRTILYFIGLKLIEIIGAIVLCYGLYWSVIIGASAHSEWYIYLMDGIIAFIVYILATICLIGLFWMLYKLVKFNWKSAKKLAYRK